MTDEELDVESKWILNTDNYKKGLKEVETTTEKTSNKITELMKKAGSALIAAFAIDKIKDFFMEANKEFEDATKNINALNQALKTSGKYSEEYSNKLLDQASALQELSGIEDDEIITAQRLLTTFQNLSEETLPDATKAALDMSVALGQDMQSSAIQLGKALDNPIEGLSALGRVGIKFTKTQEDIIKKFMEQGDVMSAQNVILKEVEKRFGGMAETMKTKSSDATLAWKDFLEAVGQKSKPAFDKALEALASFFSGAAKIVRSGGNETREDLEEQRKEIIKQATEQRKLINDILEGGIYGKDSIVYQEEEIKLKELDTKLKNIDNRLRGTQNRLGDTAGDALKRAKDKANIKTDEQIEAEKKAAEAEQKRIDDAIEYEQNRIEDNEKIKNETALKSLENQNKVYSQQIEAHNDYLKAMSEGQENALKKEADIEDERLNILNDIDKRTSERDKKLKKIEDTKAKQAKDKKDAEDKDIVKKSENEILMDKLRLNSKQELYNSSETMLEDWITGQWKGLDEYAKILTEDLQMQSAKIAAEAGLKAVLFTAEGFAFTAMQKYDSAAAAFEAAAGYATTAAIAGTTSFALGSISRSVGGNESNQTEESGTTTVKEQIVESSTKKEAETVYITNNDYVKLVRDNQFPAIQKILDSGKKLQVGG